MPNLGTVLISLLLIAAVAAIAASLIRNRRTGKSTCGCGCKNCAMSQYCHQNKV